MITSILLTILVFGLNGSAGVYIYPVALIAFVAAIVLIFGISFAIVGNRKMKPLDELI